MKKYILSIALVSIFSLGLFAQEEVAVEKTSKKEIVYPQEGTFSVGVDALPYINFLGNMFNGTENNSLNVPATTIFGKYFISKKQAIRFELNLNNHKTNERNYVTDQSQIPVDANIQIEDLEMMKRTGFGLGLGYQEYLGEGRLRAFYGGMLSYSITRTSYEYKWGNEMTVDNTAPISTPWFSAWGSKSARNLTYDYGTKQSISAGAFVGVEYFLNSVISLGGEVGLYAKYAWDTQADRKYETVEQASREEKTQALQPKSNEFSLTTNVYDDSMTAGRIYINFYF